MNNIKTLGSTILSLKNGYKSYREENNLVEILKGINFSIKQGEVIALLGASGSGKSTLLNILGLLDNLTKGELLINDSNCTNLNDSVKCKFRKNYLGFVFQFHHLLVDFTALENVFIPQFIKKEKISLIKKKALLLLEKVGLKDKIHKYPNELSGGERQRVAIARALINNPLLILADEPTGNLDSTLSIEICKLIINLVKENNSAAVIATHDLQIAKLIGKQIYLQDGKIISNKL